MYILLIIIALILIATLVIIFSQKKQINNLKQKTDFAILSDDLITINFEKNNDLGTIAKNFNKLGAKFNTVKKELEEFEILKKEKGELGSKLSDFEVSVSQVNLLTEIGRDISSSINLNEIHQKLFHYIESSMMVDEVQVMINYNNKNIVHIIENKNLKQIQNKDWIEDKDNILYWNFLNKNDILLSNASKDYGQYVFKPIKTYTGKLCESVIAIAFSLNEDILGSLCVLSDRENVYDKYHFDFLKSLASYVTIATVNANLFAELDKERVKSDNLLLNILPKEVSQELKNTGQSKPKLFEQISVMFSDFKDFTKKSEKFSPTDLVNELDFLFKKFDLIIEKHQIEKIKTIGDAYMCASGMPVAQPDHAVRMLKVCLEIQEFMLDYKAHRIKEGKDYFETRIGVHSGPVVAGIVGSKKFAYDIWGDTVNTAARMEQNSEAGKINISGVTYELIKDEFKTIYRGKINAKNKGEIDMYFVNEKI